MPVTLRGTSWQAQVNHKGQRYRRNFETKNEALAWEADTKGRCLRGEPVDMGELARSDGDKPRTLGELRDYTLSHVWGRQKASDKTEINADHVVRIIGASTPVHKIDRLAIDRLIKELEKTGNSPATVNRKRSALSKMLSVAHDLGVIPAKPKFPTKLKENVWKRFRVSPQTEAVMLAFFDRLGQTDMHDWAIVALDTGARLNEVQKLQAQDVGKFLMLWDRKSGRNTAMPMTPRVRAVLERRSTNKEPRDKLFPDLTQDSIRHYWTRLREHVSLVDEPSFTPHILRHEFCSRLADRNVHVKTIMDLADHSNLSTTQRYLDMSPVSLEDAIASLASGNATVQEVAHVD